MFASARSVEQEPAEVLARDPVPSSAPGAIAAHALPASTDVLIVGAGPTGLVLAATLARAGVSFVLVDKLAEGQNTSRAAVIHAHTLEMLDAIGAAGRLAEHALRISDFLICDRDRTLVRIDFAGLPTPHPYLMMIPQDVTERVLAERLVELGGRIHRGYCVTSLQQNESHVKASITSADGQAHTITARFAVGADGMHSVVRDAAGIQFTGDTYAHSFILADVKMNWGHGRDAVRLFFSPAGLVVVAPLPDGGFRIVATVDDAPERLAVADIQALLDARGPEQGRAIVTSIGWNSRFRVHHRLANSYRNGRLLLMGDAAHVHSPAGGQGMNTGIVDACVLGNMLTSAIADPANSVVLDSYGGLRRPAAQRVLRLADRLTMAATLQGAGRRKLRNLVLGLAGRLAPVQRVLARNLSGLSRREAVWPRM